MLLRNKLLDRSKALLELSIRSAFGTANSFHKLYQV